MGAAFQGDRRLPRSSRRTDSAGAGCGRLGCVGPRPVLSRAWTASGAGASRPRGEVRDANPVLVAFVDRSRRQARFQAWRGRALLAAGIVVAGLVVGGYLAVERVREGNAQEAARAALVSLRGGGAVDVHEVTNGQYQHCVDWGQCARPSANSGPPSFVSTAARSPVFNIDATAAAAFCSWVGRRLPTLPELREATPALHVTYLLSDPGGREWTSTPFHTRLWTVLRNPDGTKEVKGYDPAYRDFQSVFRCARR